MTRRTIGIGVEARHLPLTAGDGVDPAQTEVGVRVIREK